MLSGNMSLNQGSVCKHQLLHLHLMHLNINSLLPKIVELRYIARLSNAAVTGIYKSKLDKFITDSETLIDNYDLLHCDKNRNRGGIACYIRNDLSYAQNNLFPNDIENVFFEIHSQKQNW